MVQDSPVCTALGSRALSLQTAEGTRGTSLCGGGKGAPGEEAAG